MPALSPRLSFALFAVLGVAGCAAPATWIAYGAPQRGLQLRVKAPRAVEEGVRLPVRVHFRYERDGLPADAKSIANGLPGAFLALELTPDAGGPTVRVDPYDPTGGMPDFLFPLPSHALDGTPVPAERIEFPLAMVGTRLPPGRYTGRVVYSCPDLAKRWYGTVRVPKEARIWRGTVRSGPFPLGIRKEPSRTQTLLVPKTLHVEKGLRGVFRKEDAEPVVLPARNGYDLGAIYTTRESEEEALTGPPEPGGPNAIEDWRNRKGPIHDAVTIVVYESCEAGGHMWFPDFSNGRSKILWKKTYPIDLTAEQVASLR